MHTELGSWQRAWRSGGGETGGGGGGGGRGGRGQLVEEEEEEDEEEDQDPRKSALIKSNNPHLAGGEKRTVCFGIGFVKATMSPQCLFVFGHHTVCVVVLQLAPPLLKPSGDDRQGIDS